MKEGMLSELMEISRSEEWIKPPSHLSPITSHP
jgi:hypothetical protein